MAPTIALLKERIIVADIVFGMGTLIDSRGSQEQFNSKHLPFNSAESVTDALNNRYTATQVLQILEGYAKLAGDESQVFKVATATEKEHAVTFEQLLALGEESVDASNVLLVDGTSDVLVPTMAAQPANKQYVDETVINIGTGDMAKGIYDTNNSGIVDNSEAIGNPANLPLGKSPSNKIMRLAEQVIFDADTIDDMGVYAGENVANAPANGPILLEQFLVGITKMQRCYATVTGIEYSRNTRLNNWSLWQVSDGTNRVLTTTYNAGQLAQDEAIALNTDKVTGSDRVLTTTYDAGQLAQDEAIALNTAKVTGADRVLTTTYDDGQAAQDDLIAVNTNKVTGADRILIKEGVRSTSNDDTGTRRITEMVSCSQMEYDMLTPSLSALYVIVG